MSFFEIQPASKDTMAWGAPYPIVHVEVQSGPGQVGLELPDDDTYRILAIGVASHAVCNDGLRLFGSVAVTFIVQRRLIPTGIPADEDGGAE